MNIYFIRHGETDWNKARRVQGRSDIPLNETGRKSAKITAEGLQDEGVVLDKIYTSPLMRAKETAQIISETIAHAMPVQEDQRLIEFGFGALEGLRIPDLGLPEYSDLRLCFTSPEEYVPLNGGETFEAFRDRANLFLKEELEVYAHAHPDHSVAVVCHGAMIRALLLVIKELPVCEFWNIHQLNCCVNALEYDGQYRVLYENKLFYEPDADRLFHPDQLVKESAKKNS